LDREYTNHGNENIPNPHDNPFGRKEDGAGRGIMENIYQLMILTMIVRKGWIGTQILVNGNMQWNKV